MTKASIIEHDTWLYSDSTPRGRLFGAGERHPGDDWGDEPPVTLSVTRNTAETGESLDQALAEQRATFDAAWAKLTTEHETLQTALAKAEAENADLRDTIISRDEEIRQLKAAIAKFDPDGDGKPGGSVPKAAKQ